ncbi:terminal uridylyltransferase 7 isoform X2 [Tetranychus urticae]|uniref:terminal uridylyltransferase 7 isoform X2 n=1 Tax=Tetranychus urticae TaxID=32264 RepID=UPI00077BDC98|nr:terminal uridylyltransferase 7 isoform X2 [Tetranychus urticae]
MEGTIEINLLKECMQNCINRLDKPSFFRCELCRVKIHSGVLSSHLFNDRKHKHKFFAFKEDIVSFSLPKPGQAQLIAINAMVEKYATRLLTPQGLALRLRAVTEIERIIQSWFHRIEVHLRPYGSTVSGFALDTSDVNVELMLDNEDECNPSQVLQQVAMQMELDPDTYLDLHKEFDISSPRFSFKLNSPQFGNELPTIHFGVYSSSSYEVAEILAKYASLDSRVTKLAACFKIWAQNCGFDRPDHGFWPSHAFHIMTVHFLQSTSPPVLPSFYPADGSTPSKKEIDDVYKELKQTWVSDNRKSLGELWIELLAYYAKDFCSENNVVNLRGLKLTLSSKEWSTCILAVEDPVHSAHNLSRSIGRKDLYFNYHHNLVRTYSFFMAPRNHTKCLLNNLDDFILEQTSPTFKTQINAEDSDEEDKDDDDNDVEEPRGSTRMGKSELNFNYHVKLSKKFGISFRLRPDVHKRWANLKPQDFYYSLEINRYPFFKEPPRYCIKCKRIDHYKSECTSEKLPDLLAVPNMLTLDRSVRLDEVCRQLYYSNRLDDRYEKLHQTVLLKLTEVVRMSYPNANLQLFGSSKNGFGAKKCDLDLCMTFEDNETGKDVDQTAVISTLAKDLRKFRKSISNLQPIPQAKVPVLKLRFLLQEFNESFDCDISLYNLLASHNTRLLRTYCQIDERVAMLGFTVKQFFKQCGICDASKGSLSSYAYTLMTLYYLQRCSPPVIPILQELYDGDRPPERIVDGYNTWFFEDLDRLQEKWIHFGANTLSVGNLFYGFTKFYAEIFPFDTLVVCIRRSRDLTKMEKKWTGRRIAIEDPFLLSHNLGQGIEPEMARYIKASIVLGRNRIGNQPENLKKYNSWYDYFFDSQCLTDGAFPKGRGCHYCNRIGHQKSNCPEMPQNRGKNRDDYDKSKSNVKNSPKGNRNRKGIESNDFGNDSDLYSSPRYNKKSLLGNGNRQANTRFGNSRNTQLVNDDSYQYESLEFPELAANKRFTNRRR